MTVYTEWRVVSESDGHVDEYRDKVSAQRRAAECNKQDDLPDDHTVEKHQEVFAV